MGDRELQLLGLLGGGALALTVGLAIRRGVERIWRVYQTLAGKALYRDGSRLQQWTEAWWTGLGTFFVVAGLFAIAMGVLQVVGLLPVVIGEPRSAGESVPPTFPLPRRGADSALSARVIIGVQGLVALLIGLWLMARPGDLYGLWRSLRRQPSRLDSGRERGVKKLVRLVGGIWLLLGLAALMAVLAVSF